MSGTLEPVPLPGAVHETTVLKSAELMIGKVHLSEDVLWVDKVCSWDQIPESVSNLLDCSLRS